MTKTLVLTIAYNGADFSGFARQPGQLTVQGEIETALATVLRHPVETTCAGRTDSGVHALGQVVSLHVDDALLDDRTMASLQRSLNALTHDAISIRRISLEAADFSARFSAKSREYHYHLCSNVAPPIFMRDFCWHLPGDLDIAAMREAAAHLVGEHDFKSFCLAVSAVGKPTHRNVMSIAIDTRSIMGEEVVEFVIIGNAFLHSMVRSIVGTLVAVGRGKRPPDWVRDVLVARNRSAAGENAPAQGLVFWDVHY